MIQPSITKQVANELNNCHFGESGFNQGDEAIQNTFKMLRKNREITTPRLLSGLAMTIWITWVVIIGTYLMFGILVIGNLRIWNSMQFM